VTIVQGPWCDDIFEYPPTGGAGINEHGHIAGTYTPCDIGPGQAFGWTPGSGVVPLQMPQGVLSSGSLDITEDGQVVGIMGGYASPMRGFLFNGSQVVDLGTLPGGTYSQAHAMNDDGFIVGRWGNTVTGIPTSREAFIWQDGVMTGLGADLGSPGSDAEDINAAGQVTGWMGSSSLQDGNPYIWQDGVVAQLPVIPGGYESQGNAINDHGDVVGSGRRLNPGTGEVEVRGFLWRGGELTEILPLAGFSRCSCSDINDARQVVGVCWDFGGNPNIRRAFIWQNGVTTDLNELIEPDSGLLMTSAASINEAGQIAGGGGSAQGTVGAVLTPVERPAGDLDGNCRVGIVDFLRLLAWWGACPAGLDCLADLNDDGIVNELDFWILVENWG
jgi:probable HAF family extracellular repeat protein